MRIATSTENSCFLISIRERKKSYVYDCKQNLIILINFSIGHTIICPKIRRKGPKWQKHLKTDIFSRKFEYCCFLLSLIKKKKKIEHATKILDRSIAIKLSISHVLNCSRAWGEERPKMPEILENRDLK